MRQGSRVPAVQVSDDLPLWQLALRPETNARLVAGGADAGVTCRRVAVRTAVCSDEVRATLASFVRSRSGLPAVPSPFDREELLVAGAGVIPRGPFEGDQWTAELEPASEVIVLAISDPVGRQVIGNLLERAIVIAHERGRGWWRLSNSIRRWYRDAASETVGPVEVVDRIAFASVDLGAHGVGVTFDPGHLYRSALTVADYFDPALGRAEREARRREFDRLRSRGERRKGTLLYDTGKSRLNICYFERFADAKTCATTGPTHDSSSLLEYCQEHHPRLDIRPDDTVAIVSFPGLRHPVPVPAKLLRLRVMADKELSFLGLSDKKSAPPEERRLSVVSAWEGCRETVKKLLGLRFEEELWSPPEGSRELLPCPTLRFGKGRTVPPPKSSTVEEYRRYYRERLDRLRGGGLFRYEEAVERQIHLVTPEPAGRWTEDLNRAFTEDLLSCLKDLVGAPFKSVAVREGDTERIIDRLTSLEPGTAVIVFDDSTDAAAYYLLSHGLSAWRLKRLTRRQVERKWGARKSARHDLDRRKADRRWKDMILLSALDILDQMEATPWRLDELPYDACLAIDVGEGRRHFAMSALVCREPGVEPSFLRLSGTWTKPDHQHEAINPRQLRDKMAALFTGGFRSEDHAPIRSLLVLRDGHQCGDEPRGIAEGVKVLRDRGILAADAVCEVVDVHKRSLKNLRVWSHRGRSATNVLEGQAVYLDEKSALIACTGAATLGPKVTAEPCLLVARDGADIRRAARAFFALAQLNYTNPPVARRLAQPLWESDARLQQKSSQDMRNIR